MGETEEEHLDSNIHIPPKPLSVGSSSDVEDEITSLIDTSLRGIVPDTIPYLTQVEKDGMALRTIPPRYRAPSVYFAAIQQNGLALQFLPEEMKTVELCKRAVQQNRDALNFVPEKYRERVLSFLKKFDEQEDKKSLASEDSHKYSREKEFDRSSLRRSAERRRPEAGSFESFYRDRWSVDAVDPFDEHIDDDLASDSNREEAKRCV